MVQVFRKEMMKRLFFLLTLPLLGDRKSTRLNSSHRCISYAVFCLKKKNNAVSCHTPIPPVSLRTPRSSSHSCIIDEDSISTLLLSVTPPSSFSLTRPPPSVCMPAV